VPHHRHEGLELTLVLEGAFGDETGVYRRGALVVADEGLNHRPYVPGTEDCLCLTASEGRPVPTGPLMAWFVKTFS
jgi:putative transcriptional regulator